uniref:Uncharacterized protein n=1 Tax=Pavo cristatus TaxID=9049 RepID=A0A8C9FUV6_PAVCR
LRSDLLVHRTMLFSLSEECFTSANKKYLSQCLYFKIIRGALKEEKSIMVKSSPVDLVTETDQKVENFIISLIKEKYPSHRYSS